jgi:hypothetical protein
MSAPLSPDEQAKKVADVIARIGQLEYRREAERLTRLQNQTNPHDAEQRHYQEQARKLK